MLFSKRRAVVLGASRGVGRAVALRLAREGADVLAVARGEADLASARHNRITPMRLDAAGDATPHIVFEAYKPDLIVVCAGAVPPTRPLQEQDFDEFSQNWNLDVRASFNFCKHALAAPLAPGGSMVLISSGAAIAGSPLSGGYAGAKRMQMFLAAYSQREADRLGLQLRFVALAPMRMMPATGVGDAAIRAYAHRSGVSEQQFIDGIEDGQTPEDVAEAVIALAMRPSAFDGTSFGVSGAGLKALK